MPEVLPTPNFQPPATPEEAEQRFYVRYGAIIGGQDWASIQRYLKEPRRPAPTTVEQWITAAEAVRDQSRSVANPRPEASPPPTQRQHARH
jgi:hypothetical protein